MSVTAFSLVPTTVLTDTRLSLAEHRLLGALFSFRSHAEDWLVWPSRKAIAARCGITHVDHVSRVLGRLKAKGWVDIQRRRGSSLYHLSPDGRPPRSDHLCADLDLITPAQIEETQGEETILPPPPHGGEEVACMHVEFHPELVGGDGSANHIETTANDAPLAPNSEPFQAAQRVVAHLNTRTGSALPTAPTSATVRRVVRRLRHYGEAEIVDVINAKAREFRHPAALFKPTVLEAALSDLRKTAQERTARLLREREALPMLPVVSDRATAHGALSALRRTLGIRAECHGRA